MARSERQLGEHSGQGLSEDSRQALRGLPAIHLILDRLSSIGSAELIAPAVLADAARETLDGARARILG